MKTIFFILIALSGLTSCSIYNSTKEVSNMCDIHHVQMHKSIVPVKYGRACNSKVEEEYINAKSIYCMGCVVRGRKKSLAIVYNCPTCKKLKSSNRKERTKIPLR